MIARFFCNFLTRRAILYAGIFACAATSIAHGQNAEPKDDPKAIAASATSLADYARRDPTLAAALELPRTTPAQKLRTVFTLIDLGYPEAAGQLVPELTDLQLNRDQRAALVREFGSGRFLHLIRLASTSDANESIAPAKAFAQQCLDDAAEAANDPRQLAAWAAQAQSDDVAMRRAARIDLRAAGAPAIAALMAALARAETAGQRVALMEALIETGPLLSGPVNALLADGQGVYRRDVAELAGHLRLRSALPYLALLSFRGDDPTTANAAVSALSKFPVSLPSPQEAIALVERRIGDLERGTPAAQLETSTAPIGADGFDDGSRQGVATWWQWDPKEKQLTSREVEEDELRVLETGRLLLVQNGLGAFDPLGRRRLLQHGLEMAEMLGTALPASVQQTLDESSLDELSSALASAVDKGQLRAAARLAAALGARGDASALMTADGRPSPLAAALAQHDRRLQFAALSAIMKIAPQHSFAGSSAVVEGLWRFSLGTGKETALVAGPVAARTSNWAGQLRGMGYEATPAFDSRQALLAAQQPTLHARLGVIVLDSDLSRPTIREVLYQLRSYQPTCGVPIVLLAAPEKRAAMETLASEHKRVLSAPRVANAEGMASVVRRALAMGPSAVSSEQRQSETKQALEWLAQLSRDPGPYDELHRHAGLAAQALYSSEHVDGVFDLLASLGTAQSQTDLVDFASQAGRPAADRDRAAVAFSASVERFGLQLTRSQIKAQYDRYNASENTEPANQELLGKILDAIESK